MRPCLELELFHTLSADFACKNKLSTSPFACLSAAQPRVIHQSVGQGKSLPRHESHAPPAIACLYAVRARLPQGHACGSFEGGPCGGPAQRGGRTQGPPLSLVPLPGRAVQVQVRWQRSKNKIEGLHVRPFRRRRPASPFPIPSAAESRSATNLVDGLTIVELVSSFHFVHPTFVFLSSLFFSFEYYDFLAEVGFIRTSAGLLGLFVLYFRFFYSLQDELTFLSFRIRLFPALASTNLGRLNPAGKISSSCSSSFTGRVVAIETIFPPIFYLCRLGRALRFIGRCHQYASSSCSRRCLPASPGFKCVASKLCR